MNVISTFLPRVARAVLVSAGPVFLLVSCGTIGNLWKNGPRGRSQQTQDPHALTVPKKWILQSYVHQGKEHITRGQGIWIAFGPDHTFSAFDGINSTFSVGWSKPNGLLVSSRQDAYTATPDGGFHINRESLGMTLVGVFNTGSQNDISRRDELLGKATTFASSGNTLVLSDGTTRNQLRYRAQSR